MFCLVNISAFSRSSRKITYSKFCVQVTSFLPVPLPSTKLLCKRYCWTVSACPYVTCYSCAESDWNLRVWIRSYRVSCFAPKLWMVSQRKHCLASFLGKSIDVFTLELKRLKHILSARHDNFVVWNHRWLAEACIYHKVQPYPALSIWTVYWCPMPGSK